MLSHILEEGMLSVFMLSALLGGVAVALVAHRKHGITPIVFLLCHMVIEWFYHGTSYHSYQTTDYMLHLFHASLDFAFLTIESKSHLKKSYIWFIIFTLFVLSAIFIGASEIEHLLFAHETTLALEQHDHSSILKMLVSGGIIGCVVSHLYFLRHDHNHSH